MKRRPPVRARLEELRVEIDDLSRRIDEHLEFSRRYRATHGSINPDGTPDEETETTPDPEP